MLNLIFFIIGLLLGVLYRTGWDFIKETRVKLESHKEVGVTPGSYGPINELGDTSKDVGIIQPKTPQQLEYEESERLRRAQESK